MFYDSSDDNVSGYGDNNDVNDVDQPFQQVHICVLEF